MKGDRHEGHTHYIWFHLNEISRIGKSKSTLNIWCWCWSWNSNAWPPHAKNWLIGKDPDAGRDCGQEEKGKTEDEMVAWHHWLNEQSLRKLWEMVKDREAWSATVHGIAKSWTRLSNWTATETEVDERMPWAGGWGVTPLSTGFPSGVMEVLWN